MKILIVGKNSKIFGLLIEHLRQNKSLTIDSVSGKAIVDDKLEIKSSFDYVLVLSYSKISRDNFVLLDRISHCSKNIIYISTLAAISHELGYRYRYPSVKREAEIYLLNNSNYSDVQIIRIGTILDSSKVNNLYGSYKYTNVEDLFLQIEEKIKNKSQARLVSVFSVGMGRKREGIHDIIYKSYRRILLWSPLSAILIRPFDMVLKVLGYEWYGYSCIVNEKY
jgi:hypothetical protein